MSSTMMMERTGMPTMGMGYSTSPTSTQTPMGMGMNWMMVPRCTFKMERCTGGFKMTCVCDDKMACSMVQNLCTMLAGGMCSCCCVMNGMTCCYVNLTCGMCRFEMTETGFCMTCTSGDQACCDMLQACCDCMCSCMNCGCTCCMMMNGTPVCCGTCETSKTPAKAAKK